jgi:hypothetical protein
VCGGGKRSPAEAGWGKSRKPGNHQMNLVANTKRRLEAGMKVNVQAWADLHGLARTHTDEHGLTQTHTD